MKMMSLHAIVIGKEAKKPLHYVKSVEACQEKGLKGDRYYYGVGTFNKPQLSQDVREISIVPFESLALCNHRLDASLDFLDLRRNLVIKNFDAQEIGDKVFSIGTVKLRIVRTCPPCGYLSRLLDKDIMKGLKHIGGHRAIIVQSGTFSVEDKVIY